MEQYDPQLIDGRFNSEPVIIDGKAYEVRRPNWREQIEWDEIVNRPTSYTEAEIERLVQLLNLWLPGTDAHSFDQLSAQGINALGLYCSTGISPQLPSSDGAAEDTGEVEAAATPDTGLSSPPAASPTRIPKTPKAS